MLPSKIDWLSGTNVRAKVHATEDSRFYAIETKATGSL
jgi:hypothetical protein